MKKEGVNCKEGERGAGGESLDSRSLSIHGKLNPGKIHFGMKRIESCKTIAREREGGWGRRCHLIINCYTFEKRYNGFQRYYTIMWDYLMKSIIDKSL